MPERGCQTTRPGVPVVFVINGFNASRSDGIPL